MNKMWNEIWEQPAVLERCLERDLKTINEVVKAIRAREIRMVCIAARGTSDHAAVYAKYLIEVMLGIPVSLAASSIFTIYQKELIFKNTVVIGISQSGKAVDVLEVIKSANKQESITISITNTPDSPLAKEANFHLYCDAGVEQSVAATKTFTTQIFLIAQLVAEWAEEKKLKEELARVPEKMTHAFEVARDIESKVERYRFMNECFVLARGINYAIALETALKIQETTYVRAKAFATSDFQHGPIAMIDREIPVIAFAPEGPSLKDVTEIIRKLKQDRIELVIISNRQKLLEEGDCGFTIPETNNDLISPFLNIVIAQMFACRLALVKGLDPDSPRGLNKITVTK